MDDHELNRRDFLRGALGYSASALMAISFGCTIREVMESGHGKGLIIYATKYGATRDTAEWIKSGIAADVDLANIEDLNAEAALLTYDYFITGSGVWIDGVHSRLKEFFIEQASQLKGKVLASFIVCGTRDTTVGGRRRLNKYLDQMHVPLGYVPQFTNYFGGRIVVEKLTPEDKEALIRFYRKFLKKELESWDRTERNKAIEFGAKLNDMVLNKLAVK